MKLKNFALLLAGISFAACSNDDDAAKLPETKGLTFEIKAVNELAMTKAGGPLYSQEAVHNVERVVVYAFKNNSGNYTYERQYPISNWNKSANSTVFEVPEADKLPEGTYKFLAVGRDATDNYTLPALEAGVTTFGEMTASILNLGDEYEIFAGMKDDQVVGGGLRVSIMMTRKVAGVLAYFKNVPQTQDGLEVKSLRLMVDKYNLTTNLTTGLGSNLSGTTPKYIFNIDLTSQSVTDGVYDGNDLSAAGVVKLAASQLAGAFMVPTTGVTMTLGLYGGADGETPIKTWTITNGGNPTFDISANSFFSLGRKYLTDTTTGPDPDDPNDDDQAIDLMVDQEITVSIDPAWGTIYNLNLQNNP